MANNINYNHDAHRREQTQQKTAKASGILYKYADNDVLILSGPYEGKKMLDVWNNGSADDRDYIFREFWKRDEVARGLLMEYCVK